MEPINLTSLSQVRRALEELDLRPAKPLGQNFLIDRNILDILVNAAELKPSESVLEIGAGLGVVTERLLAACREVVAVEKDVRLVGFLQRHLAEEKKLTLIHGDMLDLSAAEIAPDANAMVSNLPYSSGTRMLMDLVAMERPMERLIVTVQEEVAERLAAEPGGRDYGQTSIWSQMAYRVELVKTISSTCFWPNPGVRSCIVRMVRRPDALDKDIALKRRVYALTKHAFKHRRKQLAPVLTGIAEGATATDMRALLEDLGMDPQARPENLGADDWLRLAERFGE